MNLKWKVLAASVLLRLKDCLRPAIAVGVRERRLRLATGLIIFGLAIGVRVLHWQDNQTLIERNESPATFLFRSYRAEADRIIADGTLLYPQTPPSDGDARMILHPPGYPILIAALYNDNGNVAYSRIIAVQILCDALAAVLTFLIAMSLLRFSIAVVGGLLVAVSPHLSYYSLWLSPDSLPVLPILAAVLLLIRTVRQPHASGAAAAGVMIGISCWLRANALLLAPMIAIVLFFIAPRGKRSLLAVSTLLATMVVISPITIRNYVVYERFVPLSIAAGENLLVGIGDCDDENRFGMPKSDKEAALKDAEWANRPDYAINPWSPDGIERDQARFRRGVAFISSHPVWFFKAMARRAAFMVSYNDRRPAAWPFSTRNVAPVSGEPPFGHAESDGGKPTSLGGLVVLCQAGGTVSADAEVTILDDRSAVVRSDTSRYGDQVVSSPIPVRENCDYVVTLDAILEHGNAAVKVTDVDQRITLGSVILSTDRKRKSSVRSEMPGGAISKISVPFASGRRSEVRVALSNNDDFARGRAVVRVGEAGLIDYGSTPHVWTRHLRPAVRGVQRYLFTTGTMLPLVIAGVVLLAFGRRKADLAILLTVPVYYLAAHSVLSTEYRYILGLHYIHFIPAAVSLRCVAALLASVYSTCIKLLREIAAARRAIPGETPSPGGLDA